MSHEELLQELESLVSAIEDTFAILAGTIAETAPSRGAILKNMIAANDAMNDLHGRNEWRDRLTRSALKIAALKARSHAAKDPELASLISIVLGTKGPDDSTH